MKPEQFPNAVDRTLRKGCTYHDITHVRWVATVEQPPRHLPDDWGGMLLLPGYPVIIFSSSPDVPTDTLTMWINPDFNPNWADEYQQRLQQNHSMQMDPDRGMTLTGKVRKKRVQVNGRAHKIDYDELWAEILPRYHAGESWRSIGQSLGRPESTIYRCYKIMHKKKQLTTS